MALTTLAAVTIFLLPAHATQDSSSPAKQAPPPTAAQDSSASAPAKPADKTTDAKATPAKPDAKASAKKPAPTSSAAKPAATTDSQANAPAKAPSAAGPTASHAPTASASHPPAASAPQSPAGAPKKAAATKTTQGSGTKSRTALTLTTPKDKTSYAIGINVGKGLSQNLKQAGLDIDPAIVTRAIKDVLSGDKPLMTDDEAKATLTALQADLRKKQEELRKEQEAKMAQLGEANKKEGDEFLAANKVKEGVTTLPDGLQYKILQEGTGPKPTAADAVTVNYSGKLLNGTEFDSSYKRNQPLTIGVSGQIIKGWTEALELMPVGSKWQLFIPSDLAYGPSGRPPTIGPSSTLVFEVELLSIQPRPAAPAPSPAAAPAPTAAAPGNAPAPSPAPAPNSAAPPKPAPPAPKPETAPAPTPKPQTP